LKRAEVFYTATSQRIARVRLATKMDVEVLKPVIAAQRNAKKETKKVFWRSNHTLFTPLI